MDHDEYVAGQRRQLEAALPRILAYGQLSPGDKWQEHFESQDPDIKAYWRNRADEILR